MLVYFGEAADFVARGCFGEFVAGPVPAYEIEGQYYVFGGAEDDEARYLQETDIASAWLERNIRKGKVRLFGYLPDSKPQAPSGEIGRLVIPLDLINKDGAEILLDDEWMLQIEGDDEGVTEIKGLMVSWEDLIEISLVEPTEFVGPLKDPLGRPVRFQVELQQNPNVHSYSYVNPNGDLDLRRSQPPRRGAGGRPPKYDWEAFAAEIIRIANTSPDGLPDRSELTKIMAEWCAKNWSDEPADSLLRQKLRKLYPQ